MTTYSSSLQLALQANGENAVTWGDVTNTNWTLIEQAVCGTAKIVMSDADYVLANPIGLPGEAHAAVLYVTGTLTSPHQIVAPLVQKVFLVYNATSGGKVISIGATSGSVVEIPNGTTGMAFCDGTNFYPGLNSAGGDFSVAGSFSVQGNAYFGGTVTLSVPPLAPSQMATKAYADQMLPVTRNVLTQNGVVGGGNLSTNLFLGLSTTGVIPGIYSHVNVTVDAYGRIVNATNGSGPVGGVPSISTVLPMQVNGGTGPASNAVTLSMTQASATLSGYVSSGNFASFDSKANVNGDNVTAGSTWKINVAGTAGGSGSLAFLGTPSGGNLTNCTVGTQAYFTSNVSIANTEWFELVMRYSTDTYGIFKDFLLGAVGWQTFPTGFTITYGYGTCSTGGTGIAFFKAFPNFVLGVQAIVNGPQYATNVTVANMTKTGFTCYGTTTRNIIFFAIGY